MENDNFGDARMKKDAGRNVRGTREDSDTSRVNDDGGSLTAEERRRLLRQEWVQEILPSPPTLPGFHCCWLSTTNSTDPVYKRIQRGYIPVKATEVPGFGGQYTVADKGEFDGCVACNEMLLFKISVERYNDLMTIYHHDMPIEAEDGIMDRLEGMSERDSNGRKLLETEGDFDKFGRSNKVRPPSFIS